MQIDKDRINPLGEYLKSNKKTHIIFDFDETIVKLFLPWDKAMIRIKKDLEKLDPKILTDYQNHKISYADLQNIYVKKYGGTALKLFLKNNSEFETEELKGYLENDAVIDFIKKSNKKLFIWSTNSKLTITKVLKELKILDSFSTIVTRDDVKYTKPEVDGFKLIDDKTTPKNLYLFVGDSANDKKAAEKIGIDFFLENIFIIPGKH